MLRDGYVATLIRDVDVDHLSYRPVQMYLNGNYWGIHNLREKTNEHLLHLIMELMFTILILLD